MNAWTLRVASAHRTVSEPGMIVIAGVIPMALHAAKRRCIYLKKGEGSKEAVACDWRKLALSVHGSNREKESQAVDGPPSHQRRAAVTIS